MLIHFPFPPHIQLRFLCACLLSLTFAAALEPEITTSINSTTPLLDDSQSTVDSNQASSGDSLISLSEPPAYEAAHMDELISLWESQRDELTKSLPKLRGLKTALIASFLIGVFLFLDAVRAPRDLLFNLQNLNSYPDGGQSMLASSALALGVVLSGVVDILLSLRMRQVAKRGAPSAQLDKFKQRGIVQIVLSSFMLLSTIAAQVSMGLLAPLPLVGRNIVALVSSGLFLWGGLLYWNSFGLSDGE
ncbi:hypothetical protein cyc_08447 [Cyclospora cayetanensis]|uniref:Transmembrane protein n=1 Tax=Cyclospora cayetanensis TaxID=88456 RepID=A0A1D3D143_9EIME|nr:hypothetical protein cyc_08447 [Cyclospora cayetanensis]